MVMGDAIDARAPRRGAHSEERSLGPQMGPLWAVLLGLGRLAAACNSDSQCDFPFNNPFTTQPFWNTHTAATGLPPTPPHPRTLGRPRKPPSSGPACLNTPPRAADFPGPCCAVMPGTPQIETGGSSRPNKPWNPDAKLIPPPDMDYPGAACPPVPDDVIVVPKNLPGPTPNSTLYSHTEVFFAGWAWDGAGLGDQAHRLPHNAKHPAGCSKPHPFYTQYTNAYAEDTNYTMGMPTLGSAAAHPNAVLKAADTLAQMLKQIDAKVQGVRQYMVEHRSRFAVWADSERRNDTCDYCRKQDPTFDW